MTSRESFKILNFFTSKKCWSRTEKMNISVAFLLHLFIYVYKENTGLFKKNCFGRFESNSEKLFYLLNELNIKVTRNGKWDYLKDLDSLGE